MASGRYNVDYQGNKYNRKDESHREFIQQEIDLLEAYSDRLTDYDINTGLMENILVGAVVLGVVGGFWFGVASLALIGGRHDWSRPDYAEKYQSQLTKLVELYEWCVQSDRNHITSDPVFRNLTRAIINFVSYEDLKRPFGDWKDTSPAFQRILKQNHLHRDAFLTDINAPAPTFVESTQKVAKKAAQTLISVMPESVKSYLPAMGETSTGQAAAEIDSNNHGSNLDPKTRLAQLRFTLYGQQKGEPVKFAKLAYDTSKHAYEQGMELYNNNCRRK